jgi:NADH-quinone oxidoreductase subunit A
VEFPVYAEPVNGYLDAYLALALLLLAGVLVVTGAYGANRILRPSRPVVGSGKFDTYECGLDPVEGGWAQLHIRYYIYAYLYVLFAVEAVFLFPWAVVYVSAGAAAVVEMAIFVAVLALGLLYAWRKNALTWQ